MSLSHSQQCNPGTRLHRHQRWRHSILRDGNRVKSVLNGVTTYYVGNYFEWRSTTSNMTRYYYAGGQRVALRNGTILRFLLGDHLGSTAVTATSTGAKYAEQRYYPWGGTRWPDNPTTPTARRFTGQIEVDYI